MLSISWTFPCNFKTHIRNNGKNFQTFYLDIAALKYNGTKNVDYRLLLQKHAQLSFNGAVICK